MFVPDLSRFVDDEQGRQPPQFEQLYLLAVPVRYLVVGVWQAHKRQRFFGPVLLKGVHVVWANDDNFGFTRYKFLIVLAQLRHVPAAEGSHQPPVEDQHNMPVALVIREAHGLSGQIDQGKIRSGCLFCFFK